MRKYKNLYQYNGKWYTKEQRVAKVGEKVLIVKKSPYSNKDFKNGDILKIINATGQWTDGTRYGNKIGQFLEQSEYLVLVPCATAVTLTENDTYWDEFTQMEQPKYEVLYGGIGHKKQPVPFSKEYYGKQRKAQIGDWVEALYDICGGIKWGEKYQVIALDNTGDWVYVRSPEASSFTGCHATTEIKQPFSFIQPEKYKLCAEPTVADTLNSISKIPKEQYTFKRKWTEAEIQEAKRTVLSYNLDTKYILTSNPMIVGAYYFNTKTNKFNCATATCMKNDTFDYWIGRMVACLKVHDKQLPEWIQGG